MVLIFRADDLPSFRSNEPPLFHDDSSEYLAIPAGTLTNDVSFAPLSSREAALTVEIARFDVTADGEDVRLAWQTASERNNAGFQIQRTAINDERWTRVGQVDGAGTTTEAQSYRFSDTSLPSDADTLAYRLKQIDTNGSVSYSETRSVTIGPPDDVSLRAPAPNPANGSVTLRYEVPTETEVSIRLYDVMGREVATLRQGSETAGRNTVHIASSTLAPGVYLIRLQTDDTIRTRRLTVVK